jgi:hypothetical protein
VNDTAAIEHLAELLGPSYGVLDYVPDWGFRLPDPWPAVMRIDAATFGQQAGNSAIQLLQIFGAEVPSDY